MNSNINRLNGSSLTHITIIVMRITRIKIIPCSIRSISILIRDNNLRTKIINLNTKVVVNITVRTRLKIDYRHVSTTFTPLEHNTITSNMRNILRISLETNASKPKRISNLKREVHTGSNLCVIRNLNTEIKCRIKLKLLAISSLLSVLIITHKISRHILDFLIHRRRVNRHIIITWNGQVTNIIHAGRAVRHNLIISRSTPHTSLIKVAVTIPVHNKSRRATSKRNRSIRSNGHTGTLKRNLIKDTR